MSCCPPPCLRPGRSSTCPAPHGCTSSVTCAMPTSCCTDQPRLAQISNSWCSAMSSFAVIRLLDPRSVPPPAAAYPRLKLRFSCSLLTTLASVSSWYLWRVFLDHDVVSSSLSAFGLARRHVYAESAPAASCHVAGPAGDGDHAHGLWLTAPNSASLNSSSW